VHFLISKVSFSFCLVFCSITKFWGPYFIECIVLQSSIECTHSLITILCFWGTFLLVTVSRLFSNPGVFLFVCFSIFHNGPYFILFMHNEATFHTVYLLCLRGREVMWSCRCFLWDEFVQFLTYSLRASHQLSAVPWPKSLRVGRTQLELSRVFAGGPESMWLTIQPFLGLSRFSPEGCALVHDMPGWLVITLDLVSCLKSFQYARILSIAGSHRCSAWLSFVWFLEYGQGTLVNTAF
jgi:hypothetical protein